MHLTSSSLFIIFYLDFFVPFWLLCSYRFLSRHPTAFSPVLIAPGISLFTAYCYITTLNYHFLLDGILFLGAYFLLISKLHYSRVDGFVLSAITTIACDQLWQIPWYFTFYWTGDTWHILNGLIAAPFALMALPLIPYFVIKAGKSPSLDDSSRSIFVLNIFLLVIATAIYWKAGGGDYGDSYHLLYVTWFAFFMLFFRSSGLKYPDAGPM